MWSTYGIVYDIMFMNITMVVDEITHTFVITMIITIVASSLYVEMPQWGVIASLAILTAYTIANATKKHEVA